MITIDGTTIKKDGIDYLTDRLNNGGSGNFRLNAGVAELQDPETEEWNTLRNEPVSVDELLIVWAASEAYQIVTPSRDSSGLVVSASIVWPDGSSGAYTVTSINEEWGSVDSYTLTHTTYGKTVTRAAATRDADGYETSIPLLTVT